MTQVSDRAARMLAAREEIIERILKSAEAHALDDAELVAASRVRHQAVVFRTFS